MWATKRGRKKRMDMRKRIMATGEVVDHPNGLYKRIKSKQVFDFDEAKYKDYASLFKALRRECFFNLQDFRSRIQRELVFRQNDEENPKQSK